MKSWRSNCCAFGRSIANSAKHNPRKLLTLTPVSSGNEYSGGHVEPILYMAAKVSYWCHGGFFVNISTTVHPRLLQRQHRIIFTHLPNDNCSINCVHKLIYLYVSRGNSTLPLGATPSTQIHHWPTTLSVL